MSNSYMTDGDKGGGGLTDGRNREADCTILYVLYVLL